MLLYKPIAHKKEKLIFSLFFMIVIISQGIRGRLNSITNTSIFNYHLIPIILIILMFIKRSNKVIKKNFILIFSIIGFIGIGFIANRYSISQLIRTTIGFILPLLMLLINYKDVDTNYLLPKILKTFNIFINITFLIQIIMSIKYGRTGGIVGHPLTSGWYYGIFISLNCIYYKYFNSKKDFFIIKDILIALIGTVLASGRISLIIVLILSLLYAISCCRNKVIPYVILPIILIVFLSTSIVDKYIWEKFRATASWGDITNGRLLGIREMKFFNVYPKFFTGKGVGYSNYISQYLFEVVNFENPIIMFSFDYGIITAIMLLIVSFIYPVQNFIRSKNILLAINFTAIFIIPFTYNGLAETVGIFIVLIFIIYIFLIINNGIKKINKL
ncbi:hypothetical protein PMY38_03280 [Clostridium tertium]|uniref:hypothetical protein n=1 Tax=Clostridium TaxID=1485 RepID=UPI000BE2AF9B|nr:MULTISPECIES: hypothetical protein [Clostridium]MDB1947967.1 hypothetical protein [Clostridium tertium]MDB1953704.1 hypothetical protein [Clostridium tertium]MDB1957612.1 hypothetical protein [Clostridium tertium]MDB1962998.1 hypothetical protein [Clostridium tertium]MDB1964486.1 hypothetical protein [Clostridium tertium]